VIVLRNAFVAGQKLQVRSAMSSARLSKGMSVIKAAAADAYAESSLDPMEK